LCEFIREFGIDLVLSVAPEATWPRIYDQLGPRPVRFHRILSTYLDEAKLPWITALGQNRRDRPIDIGYRTPGSTPYWFGRHGFLKQTIGEAFLQAGSAKGLRLDISMQPRDAIMGDDWYRFLARCKYTLGVESGTSILDPDGSIRQRTEAYTAGHPGADFAEVERTCFPGVDGQVVISAVASRHFEACAARTCQVLTSGEYNGILQPGRHYLELQRDFSNLNEVLDCLVRDDQRAEIVERAYRDVVASGKYTYRGWVEQVSQLALSDRPVARRSAAQRRQESAIYVWMRWVELAENLLARGKGRIQGLLRQAGLPTIRRQNLAWPDRR
jgi:hypothetical protein